jgi:DUF1680 family protein
MQPHILRKLLILSLPLIGVISLSQGQDSTATVIPTATPEVTSMNTNIEFYPRNLTPLPLGEIRPEGWLKRQLRIQADGLSGHLDEFWPDIKSSGWIGGVSEGWERGPYWLDGLVPLAFLLDDPVLKEKVTRWMDFIVTHAYEDGWLGPNWEQGKRRLAPKDYDMWSTFPLLKAMAQYQEVTQDPRLIPAMMKHLKRMDLLMDEKPLFAWGHFRWMDLNLVVFWLYERTADPWLLEFAHKVQQQGYDWQKHFSNFRFPRSMHNQERTLESHGVNHGMGIKQPAVAWRLSGKEKDRLAALSIWNTLDHFHGQVTGIFSCDEHLAGRSPSQGTELCTVVEAMYSLEESIATFGLPPLVDRLERIAYNALPATFKPDMWAHQYDQQVNQVLCRIAEDRVYTDNGPDANIFGLEPNFGCCTANLHQGWPKLTTHLWMKLPSDPKPNTNSTDSLVGISYAPCTVQTRINQQPVKLVVESEYPFQGTIRMTLEASGAFPLILHIPSWAEGATVAIQGTTQAVQQPGFFHHIKRKWEGSTLITLHLPMSPRIERRFNESISILRGPLVFSLKIDAWWKQVRGTLPHADWEVYPLSRWGYGLAIDLENPSQSVIFSQREMGQYPFSGEGTPLIAKVKGCWLPDWVTEHNAALPPPPSPVHSEQPLEDLTLLPYGATSLRITEFPVLKE